MISKDERQAECVSKWRNAKGRGTLNLTFRFGKTRVADIILTNYINKNDNNKILFLVPNDITKKNIIKNTKYGSKIELLTSNQFINKCRDVKDYIDYNLVIIDECHKFLDNEIYDCIIKINTKFILCLTGVNITSEQNKKLEAIGCPIIDTINEKEAIENKWISDFVEYNLAVELSDDDKFKYAKYTNLIHETLDIFKGVYKGVNSVFHKNVFDSDFDLIIACFAGKYIKDANGFRTFVKSTIIRKIVAECQGWNTDLDVSSNYGKKINLYWNPDNIYERAKTFKQNVSNRNNILIFNRPKIEAVMDILKAYPVPTICFNESVEMAEELANYYPKDSIAYHNNIESRYMYDNETGDIIRTKSGEPKKIGKTTLKKMAIEGMRDGTYNKLFTVKSLNEGLTIENIEQVITTGGSCNTQTHENRIARGKTFDYTNPNKVCVIINIYIDDFTIKVGVNQEDNTDILKDVKSRDKQKLIERQSTTIQAPIWVSSISEIFY